MAVWEVVSNYEPTLMAVVTITVLILAVSWYKLTLSSLSPPLPPGPRELPIVGYLPFLGSDLHKQFTIMAHTYGPIFKFHLGSRRYIVINNLEIAKEVLRDQDNNFTVRIPTVAALIITYGGQDITFSNTNWRDLRKLLVSEVLSHKNLEAASHFRRSEVRKTIKNVYSKIGTTVNISEVCFSTEANVISSMIWENSSGEEGGKASYLGDEFQKVASSIIRLFLKPNVSDFFPSLAWLDVQGVKRDMKKNLDATVKETFRLHPVGPVLSPRSPLQDCRVGGYTIPKGCHVYLNVWSIQRDPRYWDNPLEFNPERFLNYDGTNKWDYNGNNLKFLPFGSGRRACPGMSLANKMQLYTLASLLHSFDWSLPKGEKLDFSDSFGNNILANGQLLYKYYTIQYIIQWRGVDLMLSGDGWVLVSGLWWRDFGGNE